MPDDPPRHPPFESRRIDGVSRGRAALKLLRPRQLQEAAEVNEPVSPRIAALAGLQTALSLIAAIAVVAATPWPGLVGFAALGALAALFGRFSPPQRRGRVVALAALLLVAAVLVTSLGLYLGLSEWLSLLLLALVAGVATLAVVHWRLDGPGAVIIVFAAGGALPAVASARTCSAGWRPRPLAARWRGWCASSPTGCALQSSCGSGRACRPAGHSATS